jgi:hypothetical protein
MATMPAINNRFRPIYDRTKGATPMKKDLTSIIDKVRDLLALTRATGFHTSRSIGALLADLSADELAEVSKALDLKQLSQR